uniref:VP3 n=1 Tax=Ife virus TaxID=2547357 RepID=A0A482A578_9REOV|nr:VP3 [Ife virus]
MDTQPANPYLEGDRVSTDNGVELSLFALQEILHKVRENQTRLAGDAPKEDDAIPEVQKIINSIRDMASVQPFKVIESPPKSFRCIPMQNGEDTLIVDVHYEKISQIGGDIDEERAYDFYVSILEKVNFIRDQGAFLVKGLGTHELRGVEIVNAKDLGIDFEDVMRNATPQVRQVLQARLDGMIVENGQMADRRVDICNVAMSEPVYRIYNALQRYVEVGQHEGVAAMFRWLARLSEWKRIQFSHTMLTDLRRTDTIWLAPYVIPVNPAVIWNVPRCFLANLIMNIATCLPMVEYLLADPRISSITITQRITQNSPFSAISSMTPTSVQIDDMRKIYLALLFPGQIILDLKLDTAHTINPVLRMVAGVIGHVMFTFGPRFTNITPTMAHQLDQALNDYLLHMVGARVPVIYGQGDRPLDFRVAGRNQYDCNQLRGNPMTGAGYNGWAVVDVQVQQPTPYDHIQRMIAYCGLDVNEVMDPRTFGMGMNYHNYNEMVRVLMAFGKEQEAAFFRTMLPFHMVRFGRINQIINRDLISAFSLPDAAFNALLQQTINGIYDNVEPIVLEVSWASIWFAFTRRLEPISRSESLVDLPLIESVYATCLSEAQLNLRRLRELRARAPDTLIHAQISDVWKVVISKIPEPITSLMNLSMAHNYVNIRDVMVWADNDAIQPSLQLVLQREAWNVAADFEELMLSDQVYMHRDMVPEPELHDIDVFRRQGFYYTNMLVGLPPIDQVVEYTYEVARLQANEGRFRAALRRALDNGQWIRFGGALRNIEIRFFDQRPPEALLLAIPFEYRDDNSGAFRYAAIRYTTKATVYYLIYNVNYSDTPDSFVTLNPIYTMVKVYLRKRVVVKRPSEALLSYVNRRLVAYKSKMRLMNITESLRAGIQLAAPGV